MRNIAERVGTRVVLLLLVGGCAVGPVEPADAGSVLTLTELPRNEAIHAAAWVLELRRGAPHATVLSPGTHAGALPGSVASSSAVLEPVPASVTWSGIGERRPGLVRLRAAVRVRNPSGTRVLTSPSDPAPPTGAQGAVLIPIAVTVPTQPGGADAADNVVWVTLPNRGAAAAWPLWQGRPHAFFDADTCAGDRPRCYRWTAVGSEIAPGAASEAILVDFDVEPTVSWVRVLVVLAADTRGGR